jgi:hypothetical protein
MRASSPASRFNPATSLPRDHLKPAQCNAGTSSPSIAIRDQALPVRIEPSRSYRTIPFRIKSSPFMVSLSNHGRAIEGAGGSTGSPRTATRPAAKRPAHYERQHGLRLNVRLTTNGNTACG